MKEKVKITYDLAKEAHGAQGVLRRSHVLKHIGLHLI